jgi:hypothetical protein
VVAAQWGEFPMPLILISGIAFNGLFMGKSAYTSLFTRVITDQLKYRCASDTMFDD